MSWIAVFLQQASFLIQIIGILSKPEKNVQKNYNLFIIIYIWEEMMKPNPSGGLISFRIEERPM